MQTPYLEALPLDQQHLVRQSAALARVEAVGSGTPGVLFLCVHNAGRSQMGRGLASSPCR